MCWVYKSEKDEFRWYLQRLHKKLEDYDITEWLKLKSEIKELTILKKKKIKEIDTYRTQIEKDYNNSI